MRVGILFPVVIFITAILFLAWFFIGGCAAPGA
ncbi:YoaK family small membrane protein [Salmonella enterica]|nr:YoaK family small membrane protein [Salmonella enterica]